MKIQYQDKWLRIIGYPLLAAVSMIDKGVVYLTPLSPEEKILLSGVCAALLLQEQI